MIIGRGVDYTCTCIWFVHSVQLVLHAGEIHCDLVIAPKTQENQVLKLVVKYSVQSCQVICRAKII